MVLHDLITKVSGDTIDWYVDASDARGLPVPNIAHTIVPITLLRAKGDLAHPDVPKSANSNLVRV